MPSSNDDYHVALAEQRRVNANPRRASVLHNQEPVTPAKPAAKRASARLSAEKPPKKVERPPKKVVKPPKKVERPPKKVERPLKKVKTSAEPASSSSASSSPIFSPISAVSTPLSTPSSQTSVGQSGHEQKPHDSKPYSSHNAAPPRQEKRWDETDITLSEADARSFPPPGAALAELAASEREHLQLAKAWRLDVVRCLDGKWLAPAICDRCLEERVFRCDRAFPCSVCREAGRPCNPRERMSRFRKSGRTGELERQRGWKPPVDASRQALGLAPLNAAGRRQSKGGAQLQASSSDSGSESGQLTAPAIFQRLDGAWQVGERPFSLTNRAERKRKGSKFLPPRKRHLSGSLNASHQLNSAGPMANGGVVYTSTPKKQQQRVPRAYIPYHRSQQEHLPLPCGNPPVWASKRQQLCETLPYYRAYMSGPYMQNNVVYGSLIDKEVGKRDLFTDEVIITRCGGGKVLDEATGKMAHAADQDRCSFGLGFQRAKDMQSPIAVIAGQGNSASPSKLPHYYNVLDWFHVTDVWVEVLDAFKIWFVRMEKIRLETKSWWAPKDSPPLDPNRDLDAFRAPECACRCCRQTSKVIFEQGWACLNTACAEYFSFSGPVDEDSLEYTEAFRNERTRYRGEPLDSLEPPFLTEADMIVSNNSGTEATFNRGIVCPKCQGCSRRTEWARWSCETPNCDFTYSIPIRTIAVRDATEKTSNSRMELCDYTYGIKYVAKTLGAYNVFEYGVPGPNGDIIGCLRHFKSNDAINQQPDGPNDLFRLMQEKEFDLRRRPVRQVGSSGEILTSHYATNWGAPYKFVVAQSTRGFDEAPEVILKALKRLTWAGAQTLTDAGEPFQPFNELLSIGYFQDSNIGYHDDGESTLGPTVATLSLGAQAMMSLRPKAKAALGQASRNSRGTKPDVLRVRLDHGDVVVMHGAGVQRYYEHAVAPNGRLRFALTSRHIRPEGLGSDAERADAAAKGALPCGHERFGYDGDVGAVLDAASAGRRADGERLDAAKRMVRELAVLCRPGVSAAHSDEVEELKWALGEVEGMLSRPKLAEPPREGTRSSERHSTRGFQPSIPNLLNSPETAETA